MRRIWSGLVLTRLGVSQQVGSSCESDTIKVNSPSLPLNFTEIRYGLGPQVQVVRRISQSASEHGAHHVAGEERDQHRS